MTKGQVTGKLCKAHGGAGDTLANEYDKGWQCDECSCAGLNLCKCGSKASIFGEALCSVVRCRSCNENVFHVGYKDIRELWNSGVRGEVEDDRKSKKESK